MAEQGPDPTRLLALRYEPSEFEVRRSRAVRTFVVLFLLVGAAAAVWGLSLYLLSHSWSSGSTLALVLLGIIVVTVSGLARLFMVERLPRIVDGVMRLPFPMRTPTGRIREVRLSSIQRVTPEARPGEPFGVWVDMKDGSRFYISWTLLGNGGTRALEGLCRAVCNLDLEYSVEKRGVTRFERSDPKLPVVPQRVVVAKQKPERNSGPTVKTHLSLLSC